MSHISYCNLSVNLAMSTAINEVLVLAVSSQISECISTKSIPLKRLTARLFLARQGLYVSAVANKISDCDLYLSKDTYLKASNPGFIKNQNEQPFVHINEQINGIELSLENMQKDHMQKRGEILLAQIANADQNHDATAWMCWTNNQGYLYFQPTTATLIAWLKMLFDRSVSLLCQNRFEYKSLAPEAIESLAGWHGSSCLDYLEQRCHQLGKLAGTEIAPWTEQGLVCATTMELELIYELIAVYDALCDNKHYKIVAAGKSLVEKFLEFDRTCRLLDLVPGSSEFQARAGLIVIVRSAARELLASDETQPDFGKIENHKLIGDKP
jgi:hypothetical protein